MPAEYHVAPDAVSFTSAISGCERAGEWMAAAQLLRQMREAVVSPTMLTYSKLLFVHAALVVGPDSIVQAISTRPVFQCSSC